MCHLAPYAMNMVGKHDTELTRYFSEMNKAVDFLHFKVGWDIVYNVKVLFFLP